MSTNGVKTAKIVFVGQTNVGKSSIVYRGKFEGELRERNPTIAASFDRKTVIRNGQEVILEMWDTAGQERFNALVPFYFRGSRLCIIVFDLSDNISFKSADYWKRLCDKNNLDNTVTYFLVGNKADKEKQVSAEDIIEYCANNNISYYLETSAFTGDGITELYNTMADAIISDGPPPKIDTAPLSDQTSYSSYCLC